VGYASCKPADALVCMSVCLSVRSHISKTTCPNFTKVSVHVARDRGLVMSHDSTIRYVLPVLWTTLSYITGHMARGVRNVNVGEVLKISNVFARRRHFLPSHGGWKPESTQAL